MRWPDERYVRVYTRDTVSWKMLPWQGKALLLLLLRKVDRAGLLDLGEYGPHGLAAIVDLPLEVIEVGFPAVVKSGTVIMRGSLLVIPNFIEAQEAIASDAQRKRDQRERERSLALYQETVTQRDEASHSVTDGHDTGQSVTQSHEQSRNVTSGHSVPSLTVPSLAVLDPLVPASPGPGKPGGNGQAKGEGTRRAKKPKAAPGCEREVIAAYCDEWVRVCKPADGKSPTLDGKDVGAAVMLAKRGLVEATELVKRYLADPDPWLCGRGHLLRDLPSRLNAYRRTTGPPPAAGAAKGFARAPTERPKESYDATHEL